MLPASTIQAGALGTGIAARYNTHVHWERRAWSIPRGAALALLLALGAAQVGVARAHIGPAAVRAVLAMEGGEPSILLLNEGLGLRKGDAWHYVCPALWGDFGVLAADTLQDGTMLIGGESAVWLFQADGSVVAHPTPAASGGMTWALGASRDHGMQLSQRGDLTQLLRIGPDQADVVWSDLTRWFAMGVGPDFVQLLRIWDGEIETLRLATDGSELARESVMGPPSALGETARVVGTTVYYVVQRLLDDGAYGIEAALIEDGVWRPLHTGISFIGPALGPRGELIAGIDGQLSTFENYEPKPLPLDNVVNCVDDFNGFVYVCDSIGLRELNEEGPQPPLFELEKLQAPELDHVPEERRMQCEQQWGVYQGDLAWIGMKVPGADGGVPGADGGVPGATDAGSDGATSGGRSSDGGCSCHLAARARSGGWGLPLLLLMAMALIGRRSLRGRAHQ